MSTGTPEAARNHSRSRLASRAAPGLVTGVRAALAVAGAAGVLLVVVATFATIIEITVAGSANITADIDRTASGWDRHGVALLLLAGFALVMLIGALRGGRPAMVALAICGLAVVLIAVIADAPDLDQTGRIGELYEDARAEAGTGFYMESLGGALLLIAGVGMLVLGAGAGVVGRRAPTGTVAPDQDEDDGVPATGAAAAGAPVPGGGAGVAVRRLGAGAASGLAKARTATAARGAARRERAEANRRRAEAAQVRARGRAEASSATSDTEERSSREPDATPRKPGLDAASPQTPASDPHAASPQTLATAAPEPGTPREELSFDERLRQARERAQRKP